MIRQISDTIRQISDKSNTTILRYLVAFSYDESELNYDQRHSKLNSGDVWEETSLWVEGIDQDLYDYILDQFQYSSTQTNIGSAWRYSSLENLPRIIYHPKRKKPSEETSVPITDLGLFLFRSNVGFLWYEIDSAAISASPDDIFDFQYDFKELNKESNLKLFSFASGAGEFSGCTTMGLLVDQIIMDTITPDIKYFSRRPDVTSGSSRYVPDKAILFSYLATAFDRDREESSYSELIRYTYYLTNGFNYRYAHPDEIDSTFFHPFQHVYWSITNLGCACCVKYTSADRHFFTEIFQKKICTDYFTMYLLLLHQSYSLLQFATRIEHSMPAESSLYMSDVKSNHKRIEDLLLSLNTFLMKNVYASVSHIQHQNEFYQYGIAKLHIEDNIRSINLGADAIENVLMVHENRREAEDDNKRNMIFLILSSLVVFSALADANTLFDIDLPSRLSGPAYVLVMGSIIVLGAVAFGWLLVSGWRALKRRINKRN